MGAKNDYLEKLVSLVTLIAEDGPTTVPTITEKLEWPESTTYRLVKQLKQHDILDKRAPRGTVRLGLTLLSWGEAQKRSLDLNTISNPVMRRLRDNTGLTVFLVVQDGNYGVCINRVGGTRVESQVLKVGARQFLHIGAASRALLTFADPDSWEIYIESSEFADHPTRHAPAPEEFLEHLNAELAQGYTLSDGDVQPGLAAVGFPIRGSEGELIASLSISGLRDEVIGADLGDLSAQVRDAANEISARMGYRSSDPRTSPE
jgi:DNA-binding IclR family transcriptional regulator